MTTGMEMPPTAPLFRDPVSDGAADPVVVFNRAEGAWWIVYTARRAAAPGLPGVEWVHGTDLGVASSDDGGRSWTYRGTLAGLDTEWGRHTYWAPEIIDDGESYHMFVSYIRGVPAVWTGHERTIRHYVSPDLVSWTFRDSLDLSSRYVIDACAVELPGGGYRLWYKDEADDSATWFADSPDLSSWTVGGRVLGHRPHEGPNVFPLGDAWWMIVDEWEGQRVLRSTDLTTWEMQGRLLDAPGTRPDDGGPGHHADVVVRSESEAIIFYFTHPGRRDGVADGHDSRRSSLQAAVLRVEGGTLVCERDAPLPEPLLDPRGPAS